MPKRLERGRALDIIVPDSLQEAQALAIAIPRGVTVSATGAEFPEDLDIEDWTNFGRKLHQAGQSYQWVVADWIRFGRRKYGEMYEGALERTGFSYSTLRKLVYVADKFEMFRRRNNLSPYHHLEVAALPPKDQDRLLKRADDRGWTRKQLREEVWHVKSRAMPVDSQGGDRKSAHPWLCQAKAVYQKISSMRHVPATMVNSLDPEEAQTVLELIDRAAKTLQEIRGQVKGFAE